MPKNCTLDPTVISSNLLYWGNKLHQPIRKINSLHVLGNSVVTVHGEITEHVAIMVYEAVQISHV